jgi:RNA polymerase primary sigma factor
VVEEALRASMVPLSLEAPVGGEEEDFELGEMLSDDHEDRAELQVNRNDLRSSIELALEGLSELEQTVISKRFGLGDYASGGPQTLDDIADQMKLSRERVRHLEIRTLRKLRRRTRGTPLENAFGDED